MIRAYIREDFQTLSLAISLVEQRDNERPTRIMRIIEGGDSTVYQWADLPESIAEPVEPTLRIGDSDARALLEALVRHYSGAEDTRALRRDYDAERKRVDALTGAFVDVARRLAESPWSTRDLDASPGTPDDQCIRCGKARGVRLGDGSLSWIARWDAPACDHALPVPPA